MNKNIDNLMIENAEIIFRNFEGRKLKYNEEGKRNFCVILDGDTADQLRQDGWNVKELKQRDEDSEPRYYLKVNVSFEYNAPKIYLVTRKGLRPLDEDTAKEIDYAEIKSSDLTIRPYFYETANKKGISAYLKNIYVTLEEDLFQEKYSNIF